MKTLYVLRHAKAEMGGDGVQDIDRELTQRGQNDARALGDLIVKEGWQIDRILCSTAVRTRQTATLMNEALVPHPIPIDFCDSLYLCEPDDLMIKLQQLDEAINHAMIVAHNPGIHQFCLMLAAKGKARLLSDMAMRFPTCAVATIELNIKHWQELRQGCGTLLDFIDRHMTGERLD